MPKYDPYNPTATTDRLPTATLYQAEVEKQAQYMFKWWRDQHPGQELDAKQIITLRLQARMTVDDFRSSYAAEETAMLYGGDE